jgi:ribosomal protein S18 acetylase RimI-like enzyme
MLVRAFASDALINYLFKTHPQGVAAGATGFFSILMRARIALAMPTLVLTDGARIAGLAMGYDTDPPTWPERFNEEWRGLSDRTPGFPERLKEYEQIANSYIPREPHYYLGVLGVDPNDQGKGFGTALLDSICDLSAADARSSGVYLETSSAASLAFYQRNGFALRGEQDLGGEPLWCVYKRT